MSRIFGEKRLKPFLRTFWHTTQNLFILALFCSSYNQQTF